MSINIIPGNYIMIAINVDDGEVADVYATDAILKPEEVEGTVEVKKVKGLPIADMQQLVIEKQKESKKDLMVENMWFLPDTRCVSHTGFHLSPGCRYVNHNGVAKMVCR